MDKEGKGVGGFSKERLTTKSDGLEWNLESLSKIAVKQKSPNSDQELDGFHEILYSLISQNPVEVE